MNDLEIDGLEHFVSVIKSKNDSREGGIMITSLLMKLQEIYDSVERGCSCRRKQRAQHARAVYRQEILSCTPRDKHDLSKTLGVGTEHSSVIIKDHDIILLKLTSP